MPVKELEIDLDKILKENNMTRKDVKLHTEEYYPNGKIKMKIQYLGTWGKRKCYECGYLDYDEDGNLMQFDTRKERFSWILGMDMKYRRDMDEEELEENEGIIFSDKKPSKKTGQTYKSARTKKIIIKLKRYWDDNLPLTHLYAKDWFKKIAKDEDITPQAVKKIERQYRPKDFTPKR